MVAHTTPSFVSTRNACKLCTPLGACFAFKGIEGCVPFLHGSQGCATYIRRYMISHFKEPVDIASSSFSESATVFGGKDNLFIGLDNVIQQYHPRMVGIATTCLSETIGDDVSMYLKEYEKARPANSLPYLVTVSTPSYADTHAEGFHASLRAIVQSVAEKHGSEERINLISGMISPADIRYIKEILVDFGLNSTFFPDYADTLDGPAWQEFTALPMGGTRIQDIKKMGNAKATLEFGSTYASEKTAGAYLTNAFRIPRHRMPLPIGVEKTDTLFRLLEMLSGNPTPQKYQGERGRLIDAYADAHKYVFEKKALVYGEEDFVIAIAIFLLEIGIIPVLCASGGHSGQMRKIIERYAPHRMGEITVIGNVDFLEIEEEAELLQPDILIGNSKGYKLAKKLNRPLVRAGFPIHDRIGGGRLLHLGYAGTQQLFDRITNALIDSNQQSSDIGYFYM